MDFPHSSVGKESACHAGDSSSIPGLRRSAEEGIGYPLKYTWASLVAQLVKNPPAMQETWVWSLGREDLLEKEKVAAAKSLQLCPILCNPIDPSPPGSPSLGFSPLRYSGLENSMGCIDHGVAKSPTWLSDSLLLCSVSTSSPALHPLSHFLSSTALTSSWYCSSVYLPIGLPPSPLGWELHAGGQEFSFSSLYLQNLSQSLILLNISWINKWIKPKFSSSQRQITD